MAQPKLTCRTNLIIFSRYLSQWVSSGSFSEVRCSVFARVKRWRVGKRVRNNKSLLAWSPRFR